MIRRAVAVGGEAAIAVVVVLLAAARGSFAAAGLGTDIAVLALLAVGLQVTFGLSGQLNLAQAPIGALGGYVVGQLMVSDGASFFAALPVGVVASGCLGALVGLPCQRVRGDVLALVTLGAGEVLTSIYLNTHTLFGGYDGVSAIPTVSFAGKQLGTTGIFVLALVLLAIVLLAVTALARGPLGRHWRAVRDDEVGAASLGLAVGPLRLGAFAVGGAVAGVGGALYAVQESFISSTAFDLEETVDVVLVVLLAGGGRLRRTVVAAGALTVLSDRLSGYASVSEAVTGILILLLVAQRLGAVAAAPRVLRACSAGPGAAAVRMVSDGSLEVHEVGRSFGGVAAAVSLSVVVERGSVVAVCGPNGAGKTTLINLATGLLTPDTGTVTVDGVDLTGRPPRAFARAGVVRTFQSVRLFDGMTARENVLVGAARGRHTPLLGALVRSQRFRRGERLLRAVSDEALDALALGNLADRVVAELSQGQRRRVELARAMAAQPRYLVLDEPGAGVDRETVAVLADAIREFARAGLGVLIVEHDAQLLSQVAQQAVALVSGRIVRTGSYAVVADQADIAAQLAAGA